MYYYFSFLFYTVVRMISRETPDVYCIYDVKHNQGDSFLWVEDISPNICMLTSFLFHLTTINDQQIPSLYR